MKRSGCICTAQLGLIRGGTTCTLWILLLRFCTKSAGSMVVELSVGLKKATGRRRVVPYTNSAGVHPISGLMAVLIPSKIIERESVQQLKF